MNENITEKNTVKVKTKTAILDVLTRIMKMMGGQDDNKLFFNILETILNLNEKVGPKNRELRLDVIRDLLCCLETAQSKEDLDKISKICCQTLKQNPLKNLRVDTSTVEILYELGKGGFGTVHFGKMRNASGQIVSVAVKSSLGLTNNKFLQHEVKIMAKLNHQNILKMVGYQYNPLKIIMEYMKWGSLADAIQASVFCTADFGKVLNEIASGMDYLTKNRYVHRDLSSRNVLVDERKCCKIGDFGLCVYVGNNNGLFEDKESILLGYNIAPECKMTRCFTTKSDVWAMGILIWDIYFLRMSIQFKIPNYIFQQRNALAVFDLIKELPKPCICPLKLHTYVMSKLLADNPEERPGFKKIKKHIKKLL